MRRLITIVTFAIPCFLLLAAPAFADNCDYKINPEDCQNTAWTVGTVATVAAAATGAALAGGALGNGSKEEEPPAKPEPCAEEKLRMQLGSANARTINSSLQTLRAMAHALEMQWENLRQTGYNVAMVEVGALAFATWGAEIPALVGGRVGAQLVKNPIMTAIIRAFGKEVGKDVMRALSEQNIDLSGLGTASGADALKEGGLQQLQQALVTQQMKKLLGSGLRATDFVGGPLANTAMSGYEKIRENMVKNFAEPITNLLGNAHDVYGMISDASSTREVMAAVQKQRMKTLDEVFKLEQSFDDALSELDLARDSLNRCLKFEADR